jgi:hypothetical protein
VEGEATGAGANGSAEAVAVGVLAEDAPKPVIRVRVALLIGNCSVMRLAVPPLGRI